MHTIHPDHPSAFRLRTYNRILLLEGTINQKMSFHVAEMNTHHDVSSGIFPTLNA
jgi:hypothetical protein